MCFFASLCQWSGEEAGVSSALGPHDFTSAYLSLHHGAAKEAAHGMVSKETDKQFFEQRISHAVVHVSDEETAVDVPSGAGIRLGDFCAPRIVSKAICNERLRELLRCNALRVERCPITRKSVSLSCRIC